MQPFAYVFNATRPDGWDEAEITGSGMRLVLHALDPQHPENCQAHDFASRG